MTEEVTPIQQKKTTLIIFAWVLMLLFSELPDILLDEFTGQVPGWLPWCKIGLLGVCYGLCLFWKRLRPLRQYALVLLFFGLALAVSNRVGDSAWWKSSFTGSQASFTVVYLGTFIRDLGVAGVVIAALWAIKRHRKDFFLVKGQPDAAIEPVPWLGIGKGESWRTFGWIFAIAATLAVLIPVALSLKTSPGMILRAAPLLPSILLFSAINAFTEEMYFRASLLSILPGVIGKNHALLINAVLFGLAHYLYGSPPGVIGFLMTGFLGWLLGKSMLETRGLLWPWFIHFLPDVAIFASYAIAWVQA